MKKKVTIISIIVLIIDQLSKVLINNNIELNKSITIINNFFNLTYVHNEGAAFSILNGKRLLFIIIAFIAIYFLYSFINDFKNNRRNILAFSLIIGGIIGNLLDRIIYNGVIDYLDFKIFTYDAPIFNLADTFIFFGVVLILFEGLKGDKNGNRSIGK